MFTPSLQTSFSSTNSSSFTSSSSRRGPQPPQSPMATASVQVVVRVRPLNEREKKHGTLPVISASTSDKTVTVIKGSGSRQVKSSFRFDNVFTSFSTQEDVFEATLQPIIRDVLNGYESTVFAYGQTGTGKTHTMEGNLSNVQEHGVIPRSAAAIFDALKRDPDYISSTVYCSLLEIYNEELSDLLVESSGNGGKASAKAGKLAIMEGAKGPFCRGLSESKVTSAKDLLALMQKAQKQRQTGETEMNKESSRSHCIFTLRVVAKRQLIDGSTLEVSGKLHCVDLAGSECAKSCGNAGKQQAARERERMNINRSLLTLGRVVKLLKEKTERQSSSSNVRIPYRDSKLTRILQESLGGRCKTCLIATVSPSVTAIEESMSTLNYAQTANGIVNKPVTTSLMNVGGFIDSRTPKGEGGSGPGATVEHWHEMECRLEYMKSQVEEAQQALAKKHIQQQEFVERAEKAELELQLTERKFQKATHEIAVLDDKVKDVTQQLELSEKLLNETKIVLGATQRTEASLTEEGMALIAALKTTISDGDRMHQALLEKRKEDVHRKMATKEYQASQAKLLDNLLENLNRIGVTQRNHRDELEKENGEQKATQLKLLEQHSAVVEGMTRDCVSDLDSLRKSSHDGVLPALKTLSLSSKEKLNSISTTLLDGEKSLRFQCKSVLDRLEENSNQIAQIEKSYASSSDNVLAALANHLETAKENLTGTVVGILKALENANAGRQQRRETMVESITELKGNYNGSIEALGFLSKSHSSAMHQAIQTIEDSSESRSRILQSISDLEGFLGKKKNDNAQNLERQLAMLTKQHEELTNAHKKQKELNQSLVSNIMKGIESVIDNEMKSVGEFQSRSYSSLITSNEESKMWNEDVGKSTSDVFDHLESVNTKLNTSVRQNFDKQDQLCTSLESEISRFNGSMKSTTKELHETVQNYCEESTEALMKANNEDRNTTDLTIEATNKSFDVAMNQLVSGIQGGVKKGISDLHVSNTEGYKYVREHMVNPLRSEIVQNIQAHQTQVNASVSAGLISLETKIKEGENTIVKELRNGSEIALAAEKRLKTSAEEIFSGSINKHEELIGNAQWLETTIEAQEQCVRNQLKKSSALLSKSGDHLGDFARYVILTEEETSEIDERKIPIYSESLSKTKEPDEILRDAGLNGDNESNMIENNEISSSPKMKVREKRLSQQPLKDRTGCINSKNGAVDVSPPLKRVAERSKLKHPARKGSKRMKIRQRN